VVDFSLRLAPSLKLRGTHLRYFFKEALRDFLPAEIITKQKHGFGLPFGQWALRDPELRALAFDSLNALKRRDYVKPAFIDHLKDHLLPLHPNYYGTLVWVLMMLELWLQSHQDRPRATNPPLQAHVEPA
jgi:asparagine synthase (glutamine-hydrolysing)